MKTCVRFRSRHSFQCLNRRRSVTFACTLLASIRLSSASLHWSLLHSGYTSELKAIHLASGDQTGFAALLEMRVNWRLRPPSASIVQICPPVVYAIERPSGDQRGALDEVMPVVNCFGMVFGLAAGIV